MKLSQLLKEEQSDPWAPYLNKELTSMRSFSPKARPKRKLLMAQRGATEEQRRRSEA